MSTSRPVGRYQFGEWVIESHLNRICRDGGQEIQLEHKAIEVLCYLLEHAGQTVTLDELLDHVWADRVVEPNVIHRNLSRIRHALGDDPHHPTYIETISKRGYRTIAPVQKLAALEHANGAALPADAAPAEIASPRSRSLGLLVAGICMLSIAAFWLWDSGSESSPAVSIPAGQTEAASVNVLPNSVAVLPFTSLSQDRDDAFFAAGIYEEIINKLFNRSDLSVIARTSVLGYAGTEKSVQEIAAELGVRTLMTGTVRYGANHVRIGVQLIDAQSALLLWSETYDRELDDVFEIQEQIASSIARHLNTNLREDVVSAPVRNPQAYLLYLQARHLLGLGVVDADRVLRAKKLLHNALELDANDITVRMELARAYLQEADVGLATEEETRELRRNLIVDALAIDPDHPVANAWLGWHAMFMDRDWATAARQYERAMALDPADVNIMRSAVVVLLNFGRITEARSIAEYVVRHDPLCAICLGNLASAQLATRDFAEAVDTVRSVVALAPDPLNAAYLGTALLLNDQAEEALSVLASAEGPEKAVLTALAEYQLGRTDEASKTIEDVVEQWPGRELLIAQAYAWTGDPESAFDWLDRAVLSGIDDQRRGIFGGPFDPMLAGLKADPRWLVFLAQTGQAPEQLAEYDIEITLPD